MLKLSCCVLLLFLIILIVKNTYKYNELFDHQVYNNKPFLWVYWENLNGNKTPSYIQLCLDIIKKNGSKYFNVILLNESNIFYYLQNLRKDINDLPIALKTDYIRVRLLYKYGGLWMDADTLLMNDIKHIADKLNNNEIDFIGFGCTGVVCKDNDVFSKP
jgi:mannosyltransferase OCH1-like enzyme